MSLGGLIRYVNLEINVERTLDLEGFESVLSPRTNPLC